MTLQMKRSSFQITHLTVTSSGFHCVWFQLLVSDSTAHALLHDIVLLSEKTSLFRRALSCFVWRWAEVVVNTLLLRVTDGAHRSSSAANAVVTLGSHWISLSSVKAGGWIRWLSRSLPVSRGGHYLAHPDKSIWLPKQTCPGSRCLWFQRVRAKKEEHTPRAWAVPVPVLVDTHCSHLPRGAIILIVSQFSESQNLEIISHQSQTLKGLMKQHRHSSKKGDDLVLEITSFIQ